jgi:hypothetical protein
MHGYRIIENPHLVVAQNTEVARSLKERLFSWPWRPLKKTKIVTVYVPSRDVVRLVDQFTGQICFACHPDTADILRARLAESDKDLDVRASPWRH